MKRRNALKATALTVSSIFLGKTAILESSLVNPVAFFKHELDAGALMDFFTLVSDRLGITKTETNPDSAKDVAYSCCNFPQAVIKKKSPKPVKPVKIKAGIVFP